MRTTTARARKLWNASMRCESCFCLANGGGSDDCVVDDDLIHTIWQESITTRVWRCNGLQMALDRIEMEWRWIESKWNGMERSCGNGNGTVTVL
jgi:hypothetical protein